MKSDLKEARDNLRNALRASLLAARTMVDARIRRIEANQPALRDRRAPPASDQPPHEIV